MSKIYDRLTCCDLYDSDTDGIPDMFETAGMKLPTGEIIFTETDKPDSDDDGLLDGEEIAYTINDGYVKFKLVSDPNKKDSDGDGLEDSKDELPMKCFDNRFILIEDDNYYPDIEFMDYNKLGTGHTEYDPRYGEIGKVGRDYCYNTKYANGGDAVNYTFLKLGIMLGSIPLITNVVGQGTVGNWSEVYHASDFLNHFLDNTGSKYVLTQPEMREIISTSGNNLSHYKYNVNTLLSLCEQTVTEGKTLSFSTNTQNNFMVACYHCTNCELEHISPTATGDITNLGRDWNYSIGDSFVGMVFTVTRKNQKYTISYRYCLQDYYEWGYHVDGKDEAQHMLHECGLAREFPVFGVLNATLTWEKGYRIETYNQITELINQ